MIKYCPIMSYQTNHDNEVFCMQNECALWDEKLKQCAFKTIAIAVAAKPSGSFNPPASDFAILPSPTTINGTGDYINPHPYTITCNLGEIVQ